VARNVKEKTRLTLPPDAATLIVVAPAGGRLAREDSRTLIEGVVVNWHHAQSQSRP
jgi:hypothetical protein